MRHPTVLAAVVLFFGTALHGQTPVAAPLAPEQFANLAASSNAFEIESSALAKQSLTRLGVDADHQALVEFAARIVQDHEEAQVKLLAAAEADGITIPATIDDRHTALLDSLKTASAGDNFSVAYITAQVDAHEEAVALFTAFAENGADGALKAFATETLPVLKQHEEHIKMLDKR